MSQRSEILSVSEDAPMLGALQQWLADKFGAEIDAADSVLFWTREAEQSAEGPALLSRARAATSELALVLGPDATVPGDLTPRVTLHWRASDGEADAVPLDLADGPSTAPVEAAGAAEIATAREEDDAQETEPDAIRARDVQAAVWGLSDGDVLAPAAADTPLMPTEAAAPVTGSAARPSPAVNPAYWPSPPRPWLAPPHETPKPADAAPVEPEAPQAPAEQAGPRRAGFMRAWGPVRVAAAFAAFVGGAALLLSFGLQSAPQKDHPKARFAAPIATQTAAIAPVAAPSPEPVPPAPDIAAQSPANAPSAAPEPVLKPAPSLSTPPGVKPTPPEAPAGPTHLATPAPIATTAAENAKPAALSAPEPRRAVPASPAPTIAALDAAIAAAKADLAEIEAQGWPPRDVESLAGQRLIARRWELKQRIGDLGFERAKLVGGR